MDLIGTHQITKCPSKFSKMTHHALDKECTAANILIKMAAVNVVKPPPKPKNLKFVRAKFAYVAKESDELSFNEGDLLYILDSTSDSSWWRAKSRGHEGLVPSNFLASNKTSEADDLEVNPLHDACKRGNLALLEECLLNQIPVNVPDLAGNSGESSVQNWEI